jgi:hypothetical protein
MTSYECDDAAPSSASSLRKSASPSVAPHYVVQITPHYGLLKLLSSDAKRS